MASQFIKEEIRRCYTEEDSDSLSFRLGISKGNLRQIARRLGLKKGTKANKIIEGKKKCSECGEWLPISRFWKDKYQPNNYDYLCIECRNKRNDIFKNSKSNPPLPCNNDRGSMAFGVNKKHNPIIMIEDEHGNIIKGKRCKGCKINKPLTAFNKLHKEDSDDTENRKNICKECLKNKRKGNNKNGVCKNEM